MKFSTHRVRIEAWPAPEKLHVKMSNVSHVTHILKKESQAGGEGNFLLPPSFLLPSCSPLRERRSSFHDIVEERAVMT